jgi:hypothetical protein
MFQEALQFRFAIVFCYNKHIVVKVTSCMLPPLIWQHIFQIIVNCLSPIIFAYVRNQSCGYGLLSDVLYSAIFMSLKVKEENKIIPSFESLMEDGSIIFGELFLLAFNIRREVINVLDSFLSFFKKYENMKAHNVIFLMLDPRFKSLHIVSSFVRKEQGVVLVVEYDRKTLYPMLVNATSICILW